MFWDIALPVLAAFAQGLTGFLGWRVTVDGVKQERRVLYEWLFALASIVGIVSVGIAAYRGSQISRDLAEIKSGQLTVNQGIQQMKSQPPQVTLNVPSPPPVVNHSHGQFLEPLPLRAAPLDFHEGKKVLLDVYIQNIGDFQITDSRWGADIEVVPMSENIESVWSRFSPHIRMWLRGAVMPSTHDPRTSQYYTFEMNHLLSKDEADGLMALPLVNKLCVISKWRWKDESGEYQTDGLQCLQHEITGEFNWHDAPNHNSERKIANR